MSSMLDQAIVDAQALREAALKNAEQAIIDQYAPEIKASVESILEGTTQEVITEQEWAAWILRGLSLSFSERKKFSAKSNLNLRMTSFLESVCIVCGGDSDSAHENDE